MKKTLQDKKEQVVHIKTSKQAFNHALVLKNYVKYLNPINKLAITTQQHIEKNRTKRNSKQQF